MPSTPPSSSGHPVPSGRATIERLNAALLEELTGRRPASRAPQPPAAGDIAPLNVVILYEHLVYVRKAMATYLHLMRGLAADFAPDFRLWRIDHALEPELAAEAGRDIAAAEVIIVAVNGSEACPAAFQHWKDRTGQGGSRPPHAVIALMEGSDDPVPAPESWSSVLRSVATQIHPEVFVCDAGETPLASPLSGS